MSRSPVPPDRGTDDPDGPRRSPDLRAGDDDRRRALGQLQRHYSDGRLSTDELSERVDLAHAARSLGQLDQLTADLPSLEDPPATADPPAHERREFHAHLVTYLAVNLVLVGIWLFTGTASFWPIWPILGWGLGLVLHGVGTYTGLPVGRPTHGPLALPERLAQGGRSSRSGRRRSERRQLSEGEGERGSTMGKR